MCFASACWVVLRLVLLVQHLFICSFKKKICIFFCMYTLSVPDLSCFTCMVFNSHENININYYRFLIRDVTETGPPVPEVVAGLHLRYNCRFKCNFVILFYFLSIFHSFSSQHKLERKHGFLY